MCAVHIWVLICPEFPSHSFPTAPFLCLYGPTPPSGGTGGHSAVFPRLGCGLGQVNENSSLTRTLSRIPGMDRKPQLLPLGILYAKWGEIALFLLYRSCSLRMMESCSFLVCVFPTWRRTLWKKRKVTPGHR